MYLRRILPGRGLTAALLAFFAVLAAFAGLAASASAGPYANPTADEVRAKLRAAAKPRPGSVRRRYMMTPVYLAG